MVAKIDENGELTDSLNICAESDFKSILLKLKIKLKGLDKIKLTPEEKELFIRGLFAHEMRHMIQDHLLASTKGCTEIYGRKIKESAEDCKNNINAANLDDKVRQQQLEELESKVWYIQNFRPRRFIEDDFVLKFSMAKDDNRFWSTKNHFLKNSLNPSEHHGIKYYASPLEADANHYAAEFLMLENDEWQNTRENARYGIMCYFLSQADYGFSNLQKYGYPDLTTI